MYIEKTYIGNEANEVTNPDADYLKKIVVEKETQQLLDEIKAMRGRLAEIEESVAGGGLPESAIGDAGKVLTVDSSGDPGWNTVRQLPAAVAADAGKVPAVNLSGNYVLEKYYPYNIVLEVTENSSGFDVEVLKGGTYSDIMGLISDEYMLSGIVRFVGAYSPLVIIPNAVNHVILMRESSTYAEIYWYSDDTFSVVFD